VLANYRFFFAKSHGVEVNYGYSRNTQFYDFGGGPAGIKADHHEFTAAYVYRHAVGKVTLFVEGGGADYNLTKRFFICAAYRGLIYNSPTWDQPALANVDRVKHPPSRHSDSAIASEEGDKSASEADRLAAPLLSEPLRSHAACL
jgi:hypothetical protein